MLHFIHYNSVIGNIKKKKKKGNRYLIFSLHFFLFSPFYFHALLSLFVKNKKFESIKKKRFKKKKPSNYMGTKIFISFSFPPFTSTPSSLSLLKTRNSKA
eukprot:TRINITY_DN314_c4_g1_i1.p1 TRINITY_DN314_c4_g1~~TRINITY_DN314_c4_g1_i1.p1  ORF type:complete len:100 (-),score=7.97 TRINITY_DN314_c4_g1_i1:75-374(-)